MSDFDKKFENGLNRMQHAPQSPNPAMAQQSPSAWSVLWNALSPASEAQPQAQSVRPQATPQVVDPYANFANKVTGQAYK